jgi:hypothetical protein
LTCRVIMLPSQSKAAVVKVMPAGSEARHASPVAALKHFPTLKRF